MKKELVLLNPAKTSAIKTRCDDNYIPESGLKFCDAAYEAFS